MLYLKHFFENCLLTQLLKNEWCHSSYGIPLCGQTRCKFPSKNIAIYMYLTKLAVGDHCDGVKTNIKKGRKE